VPLDAVQVDDLTHWLRLTLSPGVGPVAARALLRAFGLPGAVFEAPADAIAEVVGPRLSLAIRTADRDRERAVAEALDWARDDAHHLVTLADPDYPSRLLHIHDPPALFYLHGRRDALARPMLAIVGSRNATAAGAAHARGFARALSAAGWTVASGLALGIDAAAHEGALAGGAGTVAVLGTGVDVVYPSRHAALAERIRADGALLSECPLGTGPSAGRFPRRNRLIAGLSAGVLVVEAAPRSGSLITARQAADFGREVFAIPGSIDSPLARGCHALIRDGARLVESADDVLSELAPFARTGDASDRLMSACAHSQEEDHVRRPNPEPPDPVLEAVGHDPVSVDTLAAHLSLAPGEVAARLVMLELAGRLDRLPDGRVVRGTPPGRLASASTRLL
jgi:DNA processing protein